MKLPLQSLFVCIIATTAYGQNVFPTGVGTNVGIGTLNPSERLEVIGNIKTTTGIFTNSPANGANYFGDYKLRTVAGNVISAGTLLDPDWNFRTFQYWDFPQSDLDPTPVIALSMEDRNYKNRFSFLAASGSYTQFALRDGGQSEIFRINDDGNQSVAIDIPKSNTRFVIAGFSDDPNGLGHKLYVKAGSARIDGNITTYGNVGIGTNSFVDGSDTYRLSVKGKVRAEEVKVYNTWADYVFNDDYELMPLAEVENFIIKNGHLPNVPSAANITANGLELGDMSRIQQEKIEELTLYIIKQSKDIELLKAQVEILLKNK